MSKPLYYTTHTTALGTLLLAGGPRGVCYLTLLENAAEASAILTQRYPEAAPQKLDGFFDSTLAAIDAYLSGHGPLTLPCDLQGGTPLQRMVWLEIARIPYGETISYTSLAERVGFPRAIRAVASACGANPVPLIIPCHRVLAKDGSLGGFSLGGVAVKEKLLAAERARESNAA